MESSIDTTLIDHLKNPALYDHPVQYFQIIETHISWILLTGSYAYKIKKPVNLGFLDFSTLDKRRHYCNEELRLNQRLAPELYLAVIPITGNTSQPALRGEGQAIEYALKMREFPQNAQLDRALSTGELHEEHITQLARSVAQFHNNAAVAGADSPFGDVEAVWYPVAQNFEQIHPHVENTEDIDLFDRLLAWSRQSYNHLSNEWKERKQTGFIRECHGDMHLGNMALIDGRIMIFDCLEFNERLRWIDVMSEVAFVTMDLYDRGRPGLAHRFLNDYLQQSGDYPGLRVLRFYQVYRAMVRAKVACLRLVQSGLPLNKRDETRRHFRQYLHLAERFTHEMPTPLIITHGLSGSGKTTISDRLLEISGAIRIRSDVERKRLYNIPAETQSGSAIAGGLYSIEAGVQTYRRLAELARSIISAGFPAIVDASFLKRGQRNLFHEIADELQVPFVIFHCNAPEAQLRQRISERLRHGKDPSEATLQVLDYQLKTQEPLQGDEAKFILTINN